MKKMMSFVERAGREVNLLEVDANNWTPEKATKLYEGIHWKFCYQPRKGTQRFETITWKTYLNMVNKAKGVLVGDDTHHRAQSQIRNE